MANTLTNVIPQLLAQGLVALRENALTARLVNRAYETLAAQRGSTIDVPVPSAIAAQVVAPANTPPSTADVSPTTVPVQLDQWYEAPFYLTDKEQLEVMNGYVPTQATEAVKALINQIDTSILGAMEIGFAGYSVAGGGINQPPFDGTDAIDDAMGPRLVLNRQLAPLENRHFLTNPIGEANALKLEQFANANWSGSVQAMLEGQLNRKLGFQWWMNQNLDVIGTHTSGTLNAGSHTVNGAHAVGASSISVNAVTVNIDLKAGDIVRFDSTTVPADETNNDTYVVQSDLAVTAASTGNLSIFPYLRTALAGSEDFQMLSPGVNYQKHYAFHRDAVAFATRPLEQATEGLGAISMSRVDPVSGLALRIEVSREHKRTRFSYDMLWGTKCIRSELGCFLAAVS